MAKKDISDNFDTEDMGTEPSFDETIDDAPEKPAKVAPTVRTSAQTSTKAPMSTKTAASATAGAARKPKKKKKKAQAERVQKSTKATRTSSSSSSKKYWIIGAILLVVAIALALFIWKLNATPDPTTDGEWNGVAVTVTEYSDFQCPFCKRAEETVKKLQELYGPKIVLEYKHFPLGFHQNAQISAEASECARDQGKFWEYHDILFSKGQGDGTGLAKDDLIGYARDLNLDVPKFTACLENGDKKTLVLADMAAGQAKGVSGTPAFFIGEDFISGAQPIEVFIASIDKALGAESGNIDKLYASEPAVELVVLNDKDCGAACSSAQIQQVVKQLFPRVTVTEVDISSSEGKALVEKYQVEKVPSYIFSDNLKDASKFKENPQLQAAFVKVDDMYKILDEATGATRYVDPGKQKAFEIQEAAKAQAAMDKLGMGTKPQIDFFVMSYCPYGNQAEEAIASAYKVLGDKAEWNMRSVIYSNYQGGGSAYCIDSESKYCSMHGVQEMRQDIREICADKLFGTKAMFDFVLEMNAKCTAQNADTCWTDVAKGLGLDTAKIATCEKDESTTIAASELELNKLLGVQGGPTVFVNGKEFGGARTPEGFLSAICAEFTDKPAECDNVPEPVATTSAPVAGCGI